MAAAVRGCATVISAVHGLVGPGKPSPEAIDRDANRALIQAAAAAGVQHLVLVSVHGAAPDHPMSLARAKYAAEQALQASGLAWTIVRPAAAVVVAAADLAVHDRRCAASSWRSPAPSTSASPSSPSGSSPPAASPAAPGTSRC